MIKVFESFDFSRVGQMQSLLESHGIRTHIRNQFGSSVMGEVPFVEVVPQLYVLRDSDAERAVDLLRQGLESDGGTSAWLCPACGAEVADNFTQCWRCGEVSVDC